jgi:hypothetical protein
MSDGYDCLLTLALPDALEEEVLDHLASIPEWVSGFSVMRAEGFGAGAKLRSAMEQVRGRSRRYLIQMLMRNEHVAPLVESLRGRFKSDEMAWWTVPLTGFGRLS